MTQDKLQELATEVDKEIVKHLSNGLTVTQVANKAEIGAKAMESRIYRIRAKYGCKSTTELACHFIRTRLID